MLFYVKRVVQIQQCNFDNNLQYYFDNCFHFDMEVRVGFEPTALRFCRPFYWTTLAPNHNWWRILDSNQWTHYWIDGLANRCLKPLSQFSFNSQAVAPTLPHWIVQTQWEYFGGSGEIRTHGPISESSVFKTGAINRTLPHFHIEIH